MLESCAFMYVLFGWSFFLGSAEGWEMSHGFLRWRWVFLCCGSICDELSGKVEDQIFVVSWIFSKNLCRNGGSIQEIMILASIIPFSQHFQNFPSFSFLCYSLFFARFAASDFSKVEIGIPRSPILQGLGFKFSVVIWLFSSPIGQQSLYLIWRWVGKYFAPL